MDEDESRDEKKVSRRQFLRGAAAAGAAGALAPNLLGQSEAAPTLDDSRSPVQSGTITLTLSVNGQKRVAQMEPRTTLLNALRNHLDPAVTGPKIVCDRGACGACTVLADGEPIYACMMLAADAVGKKIVTIEGLTKSNGSLSPLQEAFVEHDALMCGFCTPGFVTSLTHLFDTNPRPTLTQIKTACAGNVCRCGTYPKIFEAALAVAKKEA